MIQKSSLLFGVTAGIVAFGILEFAQYGSGGAPLFGSVGDTYGVTQKTVSPSVTPKQKKASTKKSVSPSVTPSVAASVSPPQNMAPSPHSVTPTVSVSPATVPTRSVTPTPRPSPTPSPRPIQPTPSPISTPIVTPSPSPDASPSPQSAPLSIVINEIAWMGTKANDSDEWIELYNPTSSAVILDGWTLMAEDGSPALHLNGTIGADSYFLIERTDDSTIADIPADIFLTFKNGLANAGEVLVLRDESGVVIDWVGAWYAGTTSPRASMERKSPAVSGSDAANWATNDGVTTAGADVGGNPVLGTPRARNSVAQ